MDFVEYGHKYILQISYFFIKIFTSQIAEVFVGNSKESLSLKANPDLAVNSVAKEFGKFIKFFVDTSEDVCVVEVQRPNAFDILKQSQLEISRKKVPSCIQERNKKDKLYNEIIYYLELKKLHWNSNEVNSSGTNFVKSLCEVLWYIDGHQSTISARGYQIPACFKDFQGFNAAELSKHRKRSAGNMSADIIQSLSTKLFRLLQANYFSRENWASMRQSCELLANTLHLYACEIQDKSKVMKTIHSSGTPWRSIDKSMDILYLKPIGSVCTELQDICEQLSKAGPYSLIDLHSYLPSDNQKKYYMVKKLKAGLSVSALLLIYSSGNNCGNAYFVWHVPDNCLDQALKNSQVVIEEIKKHIPVYHTRMMIQEFIQKFGRVTHTVKPAVLRYFYKDLTGDCSSSDTTDQAEIDERVKQAIEMEDPSIVMDLRHNNSGMKSQYDVFWDECSKLLEESVGTAVDDRRHTNITHIASAISIRDFRDQVAARCPADTKIPSVEWIRLQFWPKAPNSLRALHHTGRFKVRFKVQQRQFRKDHPDCHYAAGVFRYLREYAVLFREHCLFYCLDDKHRIKIGEPNVPVAAAERGRRVFTAPGSEFLVADHDFTKLSFILSVFFKVAIPDDISGSWYSGKVHISLKEGTFEPSSPIRHASELISLIETDVQSKPILFLYTDGGPDHRLTFIAVQLSLISLFLQLDLDYLCAARTAPNHSWRNPVEHNMSVINLGLQCVGLAQNGKE